MENNIIKNLYIRITESLCCYKSVKQPYFNKIFKKCSTHRSILTSSQAGLPKLICSSALKLFSTVLETMMRSLQKPCLIQERRNGPRYLDGSRFTVSSLCPEPNNSMSLVKFPILFQIKEYPANEVVRYPQLNNPQILFIFFNVA